MTDTYEGWTNRETWCAQLWMTNEQGIYEDVREQAARITLEELASIDPSDEATGTVSDAMSAAAYELATYLREMWDDWAADLQDEETYSKGLAQMVLDVGSLYRVEWQEIAEHWVREARDELETEMSREAARAEAGRVGR